MKIVVDENIPAAQTCFGMLGQVELRPGRTLSAADVRDAEVLIVRSITRVDAALLAGSRVRFVGTATIGVDHVDRVYLRQHGIAFASAPGCNARSVVEYVLAALLELEASRGLDWQNRCIGIIGQGNVGSRLKQVCQSLGMDVLACDPPLQEQGMSGLVSPDQVWQADIVSLHVPLVPDGPHATRYLADHARLQTLRPGAVLINTARGDVVDNRALGNLLEARSDLAAVLDVWEGEPLVNRELASQVDIATPHIAGYSHDGKVRGTWMIHAALCDWLGQPTALTEADLIPPSLHRILDFTTPHAADPHTCRDIVRRIYAIGEDDVGLRTSLQQAREQRGQGFDDLRRHYRVRREFGTVQLRGGERLRQLLPVQEWQRLVTLGFRFV